MNAKGVNLKIVIMMLTLGTSPLWAASAKSLVKQGNQAYAAGDYLKAVTQYDQALTDAPKAIVPLFNKANSYYHMDDLGQAIELYRDVDLKAKDMTLVEKARYNLGNCVYQQGIKQRDSDLQKAVDHMKDAISHWQRTIKVNPENTKAGRNIEVARLTIKDIMDQIKQQQDQQENDPNQPQDPNQQQQQSSDDQNQDGQEQDQPQDPNQSQDQQDPNEGEQKQPEQNEDSNEDPNQSPQSQPEPQEAQEEKDKIQQDMTAQAILDKEQRQKDERKMRQRSGYQKVDRDW